MGGNHLLMMEGGKVQNQSKSEGRHRKKLLYERVCKQIEFYFSDANLSKNRYFSQLIENDPYVPLETFLTFNKISSMVSSVDAINKALRKSEMLELSEDGSKVKRKTPININKENEDDRTIYVENLNPETNHEELKKVFSKFGKVVYVSVPKYPGTQTIKGFAFIEFNTIEEASKTVEIFQEKGSCLSSQMLPEKLCSIRGFEDPYKNEEKSKKVTFKFENDSQREKLEASERVSISEQSVPKNELKRDTSLETHEFDADSNANNAVESDGSNENKLKRKLHDGSNVGSEHCSEAKEKKIRKVDTDFVCKDAVKTSKKIRIEVTEPNLAKGNDVPEKKPENDNKVEDQEMKRKKKNRKQKKKVKAEKDLFAFGMHILPKKEWKRLRNKYLQMQRSNMNKVKQQLAEARFMKSEWHNPHQQYQESMDESAVTKTSKARVSFSPGLIIRVGFNEPVADIKLFKAEAKSQPSVQYVDIHEGSCEAYLRCSTSSDAQVLLQSKFWENMSLLQGNEESAYWEKIFKDREDKFSRKLQPKKRRGREKLIHRAETLLATHLHFDA